jgi:hypothetical protein
MDQRAWEELLGNQVFKPGYGRMYPSEVLPGRIFPGRRRPGIADIPAAKFRTDGKDLTPRGLSHTILSALYQYHRTTEKNISRFLRASPCF